MDRQIANIHQKAHISNEQPSSSCQVFKLNGRMTNFYKENSKNSPNKLQNKTRNREHKFSSSKNFKDSIQTNNGNYLNVPKVTFTSDVNYLPKKHHHGKGFVRERFVQANFQFVVSGNQDYSKHCKDPDLFISWESIEEVIFSCKNDDDLYCPICLYYPRAAKITRCGHIFCWPCILHYLSLSDKKSRPCPICFHNIQKLELKSVTILRKKNHVANDQITFNLMKIRKGSTLAVPISYPENFEHSFNVKNFDSKLDMFHKIFISSYQHKSDLIKREYDELHKELLEYQNGNMPEIRFVENALEELSSKKESLLVESMTVHESLLSLLNIKLADVDLNDYTYFYQSADGQHIYLHSINIRMLKHEYRELKHCPQTIIGKVIEFHRQTVTEEIRKRFAHLRHLPLSCEFTIAELEFDCSVVSQQTLDNFKTEIKTRKKQRKQREIAQNVRDRNIEIEKNKKFFNINSMPDFNMNEEDFPVYQIKNKEFSALKSNKTNPDIGTISESISSSTSIGFKSSFANMLVAGKTHFDGTVRKKISPTQIEEVRDESQNPMMDLTLSDYFDKCVQITKKKKINRKK